MSDDVLTLGGVQFLGYSPPDSMMAGGQQAMVVHKLPGGSRVIDILGPDEDDVTWKGHFLGNDAYSNVLTLDALRAAGNVIPLTWGGQFRWVIIKHFVYHARRLPLWIEYDITCTVYQNPSLGAISSITTPIDTLVSNDIAAAIALISVESAFIP